MRRASFHCPWAPTSGCAGRRRPSASRPPGHRSALRRRPRTRLLPRAKTGPERWAWASILGRRIPSPACGEGRVGLEPEVLQQLLGAQGTPGGEDGAPLFEQSAVVRRRAPDALAKRHDLAVEVIELAARATLEALQSRRPIRALSWKIAGQPFAEDDIAEGHRK